MKKKHIYKKFTPLVGFLLLCCLTSIPLFLPHSPVEKQEVALTHDKAPAYTKKNPQSSELLPFKPLFLTGEATINDNLLVFLWDPKENQRYMLSFAPNPQGDALLSYHQKSGTALIKNEDRPFLPLTEYTAPIPNPKEKGYWDGYEEGFSLHEHLGEMIPAQEDPLTGEISQDWADIILTNAHLPEVPPAIKSSVFQDPLTQLETLKKESPAKIDYFQGLLDGTRAALLGESNDAQTAKWAPSLGEPNMTSPRKTFGERGKPFKYIPTANQNPKRFSAENLPPGLSIDPQTGTISGIPHPTTSKETEIYETLIEIENDNGSTCTTLDILITPQN